VILFSISNATCKVDERCASKVWGKEGGERTKK
jgi:hypothetical protein